MKSKPKAPKQPKRTLAQFARDKRREGCPVCVLPVEVRQELRAAGDKKIPVAIQLEWLKAELGVTVGVEQINSHRSGRHEEAA